MAAPAPAAVKPEESAPAPAPAPQIMVPAGPLRAHPDSVRAWVNFAEHLLGWLRKHDAGTRRLPALRDTTRVALIVEPRDHPHLELVLRMAAHQLAHQGWGLIVMHGTKNEASVRALTRDWPNIQLATCGADDLPLPTYQVVMTDPTLWAGLLGFSHVLLFQTDTAILRGDTLGSGSPFLDFDWVGAPWANQCRVCGQHVVPAGPVTPAKPACGHMRDSKALASFAPEMVGNGGLSLRSPAAMYTACCKYRLETDAKSPLTPTHMAPIVAATRGRMPVYYRRGVAPSAQVNPFPAWADRTVLPDVTQEDTFLVAALHRLGFNIAPRRVAVDFCSEQVPPLARNPVVCQVTGIHSSWKYQSPADVQAMLESADLSDGDDKFRAPTWA